MSIIDTHAHLDVDEYSQNLEEIMANSRKIGVEKIIIPGCIEKDIPHILELIEKYEMLYGAVAVHPEEVESWNEGSYETLKEYAKHPKVVAIGETGLDYYWDKTSAEKQKELFREHIRLALDVKKPIIVHDRDAHKDCFDILRIASRERKDGLTGLETRPARATKENDDGIDIVMHCFSGSPEFAKECLKEGMYLAFGGVVTFKNAQKPKEAAKITPLDRLLLETDSPYLTPHPFRGQTNSPEYIKLVAEEIARLKNISVEEVEAATTQNAKNVFGI